MDDGRLATAIIGSTFGLEGEVRVRPFSDDPGHLLKLRRVAAEKDGALKELEIASCRLAQGRALVRFKGYDTPEAARTLAGWTILVPRSEAAPLREGELYVSDLAGLRAVCRGVEMGVVSSCVEGPQGLLLEIKAGGAVHLVPYMDRFFGDADLEAGTIELKQPAVLQ